MNPVAKCIVLEGNPVSEGGYEVLKSSIRETRTPLSPDRFPAIKPEAVDAELKRLDLHWNWPVAEGMTETDIGLPITKRGYRGVDINKRIACAISHYLLWQECAAGDRAYVILEHDARFIRTFTRAAFNGILASRMLIVGINSPARATRKAAFFHQLVQDSFDNREIQPAPKVDPDFTVPQGLAGNSAYVMKPEGAKVALKRVEEYGLWPNDALLCRNLIEDIGVTRTYYTEVQGLPSTTTL